MEATSNYGDLEELEETEKTRKHLLKCSISFALLIGLFKVAKFVADRSGVGIGS